MTEAENAVIFSRNLRHYVKLFGKTGKEIADAIDVSPASISYWMSGKKYPSSDNIELLARYFGIQKSDLIEERDRKKVDPQSIEARIISVGVDKMTPENREKALNRMRVMFAEFAEYFEEGEDDDDT